MRVKVDDLRNHRNIYIPIVFVTPKIKKHEVVIPKKQLLIDDSQKNIDGWINNGGKGILFDETIPKNTDKKVKSLEFLLGR